MKTTLICKMRFPPSASRAGTKLAACLGTMLCVFLAGCDTVPKDTRARFQETAQTSVVFEYNSPDYIFILKPSYRDGQFLRPVHCSEVAALVGELHLARELAVVSIPWQIEGERLQTILCDWKTLLKRCEFRQVVFVRSVSNRRVHGAVIIETSNLT